MARAPLAVVAHPSIPARTLHELIDFAKARRGELNYAGSGPATATHIAGEQFKQMTRVDMVLVQYKGSPAALSAVISGEAAVGFGMIPNTLPHVKAGKLRAFGIAASKRFAGLPDLPTAAEAGLPGFEAELWLGMLAPARIPERIVGKLNQDIVAILRSHEMQASLLAQGAEPSAGSPQDFAAFIKSETARLKGVVEVAGIRMN